MPAISMFFGIIIRICPNYFKNKIQMKDYYYREYEIISVNYDLL